MKEPRTRQARKIKKIAISRIVGSPCVAGLDECGENKTSAGLKNPPILVEGRPPPFCSRISNIFNKVWDRKTINRRGPINLGRDPGNTSLKRIKVIDFWAVLPLLHGAQVRDAGSSSA